MSKSTMTVRIICGSAALMAVAACGLIATLAHQEMVDKINEKASEKERFDPLGWYWEKSQRLRREYRRLYPQGTLIRKTRLLFCLMTACLLLSAWLLRFA
jgi:hypothetical protein